MRLPATRILVRATTVVVVALLVVFLPKARADFLNYEFAFVGMHAGQLELSVVFADSSAAYSPSAGFFSTSPQSRTSALPSPKSGCA